MGDIAPRRRPESHKVREAISNDDPRMQEWWDQVRYFEEHRLELCDDPNLLGRFVAIREHHVIDSDDDEFALYGRVRDQWPVLIKQVLSTEPIVHIRGLRVPR